jgi:hypothetical protein
MQTGVILECKIGRTRQISLTRFKISTGQFRKIIIQPFLSRFVILEIGEYIFEVFKKIGFLDLKRR